jgi:hypothetical protein
MKIKRKRATAGERIAGSVWFCKAMRAGITPEDQETLMRRIDAAVRRAVKAERDRCVLIAFDLGHDDVVVAINGRRRP